MHEMRHLSKSRQIHSQIYGSCAELEQKRSRTTTVLFSNVILLCVARQEKRKCGDFNLIASVDRESISICFYQLYNYHISDQLKLNLYWLSMIEDKANERNNKFLVIYTVFHFRTKQNPRMFCSYFQFSLSYRSLI